MIGPFHSVILRVLLTPIVASLQLFAIYVVAHGHYSPGGGFQGGVLLGASLILPLLSRGRSHGLFLLTERGAAVMGAVGVGGLFDFFAGDVKRAPVWLREIGLEWLWRLIQEPTRMWKRYLVGNVAFVARVLRARWAGDSPADSKYTTPST